MKPIRLAFFLTVLLGFSVVAQAQDYSLSQSQYNNRGVSPEAIQQAGVAVPARALADVGMNQGSVAQPGAVTPTAPQGSESIFIPNSPVPAAQSNPAPAVQNTSVAPTDNAVAAPPVGNLSSVRPRDSETQPQFDQLAGAIKELPQDERAVASKTLVQAVHQVGADVFDGYLANNFLNTYTGKNSEPGEIADQLANGNLDGFKREVMGSGPFEP